MFQPGLVGRADALALCQAALAARTGGAVVCGPPGAGVSRVLREIFTLAMDQGDDAAFRRLPDPRLAAGDADHHLVVVDDAHAAGDDEVGLLIDIALRTRLLLGVHPHLVSERLRWLWTSGTVARIDLPDLQPDEVAALLRGGGIDGELHQPTVLTLHRESAGRPGFVVDLVRRALDEGDLATSTAMWRSLPNPLLGGAVADRARDVLNGLDAEALATVQLVAVAGELPDDAVQLPADRRLDGVVEASDGQVRLVPPVMSRAVRHVLAPNDLRHLAAEAAGWSARMAPHDRVRVLLDSGALVGTDDLVAAIEHARRAGEPTLALDLSRRLAVADHCGGSMLHARILAECGRRAEAVAGYRALMNDANAPTAIRETAVVEVATMSLWDLDDLPAARAACDDAEHSGIPELATAGTAMRAALAAHSGHPAVAARLAAAAVAAEPQPSRPWMLFAAGATVAGAVQTGGTSLPPAAEAFLDAVISAAPPGLDTAPLVAARTLGADICGPLEGARRLLETARLRAVEADTPTSLAWLAVSSARVELAAGRAYEAARWAADARRGFIDVDHSVGLRWAVAAEVMAAAWSGATAATRRALARLDDLPPRAVAFLDSDVLRARGWAHAALGETSRATVLFRQAVELAIGQEAWALATSALHDLCRLGADDPRWQMVTSAAGLPADHPFVLHRAAVVARSAPGLLEAAAALEEQGRLLVAAECATAAAHHARRDGARTLARTAVALALRLRRECGEVHTPGLEHGPAHQLTPREREVARLAAAQHPSKEIAHILGLSVRTVDNALHRAYSRLGVAGRDELAGLFEP